MLKRGCRLGVHTAGDDTSGCAAAEQNVSFQLYCCVVVRKTRCATSTVSKEGGGDWLALSNYSVVAAAAQWHQ